MELIYLAFFQDIPDSFQGYIQRRFAERLIE